jgi:hypothetical protein
MSNVHCHPMIDCSTDVAAAAAAAAADCCVLPGFLSPASVVVGLSSR